MPTGVEPGCLLAGGVFLLGIVIVVTVLAVRMGGGGGVDIGSVQDYEPGSVVYFASDGLFVVRLRDGSLIVLSDLDPHNPPGRRSCRVTFRPDLAEGAERGRFFEACTGATYDVAGRGLGGDGLDLRRIEPEERDDGELHVNPGDVSGRAPGWRQRVGGTDA